MKSRSRIILPKNSNLNSLSYSHCASTNDSKDNKEFLKKQNSILKKDNVNKMKEIMGHNLHKYTTSQEEYFLNYFQTVISSLSQKDSSFNLNKKLSKICLKDCKFDIDNQNMQEKYKSNQIQKELAELTEYYKYYTNNPILYHKEYFKSLYQYYERKKYVQYKRLKAILNLQEQSNQNQSVSSKNQNISQNSSQIINQDTFYVGPFLNLSKVSSKKRHINQIEETSVCESEAFQNLNFQMNYLMSKGNSKMVPISKENNFNSFQYLLSMKKNKPQKNVIDIQELDKLYDFTKKQSDLKMQKNTRKKSQQIHNSPSKKLSKSSKKILNPKQEMQNVNKLQSQIQQFKETE